MDNLNLIKNEDTNENLGLDLNLDSIFNEWKLEEKKNFNYLIEEKNNQISNKSFEILYLLCFCYVYSKHKDYLESNENMMKFIISFNYLFFLFIYIIQKTKLDKLIT